MKVYIRHRSYLLVRSSGKSLCHTVERRFVSAYMRKAFSISRDSAAFSHISGEAFSTGQRWAITTYFRFQADVVLELSFLGSARGL
jgi:hypothetical protein